MHTIFIDGSQGTTGLRIVQRLSLREDIRILSLPEKKRKDPSARKEMLNACDVALLCLPDAAAIEAADMVENPKVRVLDTSTAHRTDPDWVYGFPELSAEHRAKILESKRIAVPGCHASGFIALVHPLVEAGILPKDALLSCHSITGYSGGGKKMIAQYQDEHRDVQLDAPRQYGLTQQHKHLKEMRQITGIDHEPIFSPIVSDFYSGMVVTVPLFRQQLRGGAGIEEVKTVYEKKYTGPIVICEDKADGGFLAGNAASSTDRMHICVQGNEDRILLTATYDNLGKGASGAAIQLMNLILGAKETEGLEGIV
ncbi:MAG: N-acetyl-gamma-glutamyl-phosphate reductase [Clostridia bacterium]|nr:N-acetyl-gamma-glutamyl-phosphate reductase [Clostridia bacterium]